MIEELNNFKNGKKNGRKNVIKFVNVQEEILMTRFFHVVINKKRK